MKPAEKIRLYLFTLLCALILAGCGKKGSSVDASKPIDEVRAEAEKMDVTQLREIAAKYNQAILEKAKEIEKLTTQIKPTDLLSAETKKLKAEIENLNKAISPLKERLKIYYDKLKEKGGDVSGLEAK